MGNIDELETAIGYAVVNLTLVWYALDEALQNLRVPHDEEEQDEVRVLFGAKNIIGDTMDSLLKAQTTYNDPAEAAKI